MANLGVGNHGIENLSMDTRDATSDPKILPVINIIKICLISLIIRTETGNFSSG